MAEADMVEVGHAVGARIARAAVILVEGESDRVALEALAMRQGRDLEAARVLVVSMGGATNIRAFLERFGSEVVGGLCDAAEAGMYQRALETTDLEARGFFVCDADLEDELIRALGPARVEQVIAAEGELASLRSLQKQPAQRERTLEQHLHRFMGVRSARKYRYAILLVNALQPDEVPRPLVEVLARALPHGRPDGV
jgi:Overcoming lysogenization defect protein-like, TOPRIM domain